MQKVQWNKKDKEILQRLYNICRMAAKSHSLADYTTEGYEEALEWLKSLKQRIGG